MANDPKRQDGRGYRAKRGAKSAFSKVMQSSVFPAILGVGLAGVGGNAVIDAKTDAPDMQQGDFPSLSVGYYEDQINMLSEQKTDYQDLLSSERMSEKMYDLDRASLLKELTADQRSEMQKSPKELLNMLYNDKDISEQDFENLIAQFRQKVADPMVFNFDGSNNPGVLHECQIAVDQGDWLQGNTNRAGEIDSCMVFEQGADYLGTMGYMLLLFGGGVFGAQALQQNGRVREWLDKPPKKPEPKHKH